MMNRLIHNILIMLSIAGGLSASAQESSPAYNFLNTTSSTRIYGLGGVNITSIDNNINDIDQNPALLGPEFDLQLGVNYMNYIGGSNFAGARFGGRASDHSGWAGFVQYYGYGSMKETDQHGNELGSFSPKDVSFGAVYSHDITSRLRGGVALKMIYSSYADYSAFAIATDLGLNYYNPERDLSLSVVVANLGGQVKRFNESYDRLPIDLRLGWSKSFGNLPVRFSITAWNLTRWHLPYYDSGDGTVNEEMVLKESFMSNLFRHLVFAADFIPSDKFNVSLGYNYKTRTDMSSYSRSILSGISIGAGLKFSGIKVGVAFAQPHSGASTIMFNLSSNFHELIK